MAMTVDTRPAVENVLKDSSQGSGRTGLTLNRARQRPLWRPPMEDTTRDHALPRACHLGLRWPGVVGRRTPEAIAKHRACQDVEERSYGG
jgi:hypothetical protein